MVTIACKTGAQQSLRTGNLTVTILPPGPPDLRAPGRGAEQWHDQNAVPIAWQNDSVDYAPNKYYRFSWTQLEKGPGEYDWTLLDQEIKDAIDHRQLFSFGIMPTCPSCSVEDGKAIDIDGKKSSYPAYLHARMQQESQPDWVSPLSQMWVPNWNSPAYLLAWEQLCDAIADHLQTSSYKGWAYRDIIRYIDIRGYGSYGEWHEAFIIEKMEDHPTGTRATEKSLRRIIDAQLQSFADFRLVALLGALDGDQLRNTQVPASIGAYLLRATTKTGAVGIRRDNWGATDRYIADYMERHPVEYEGLSFRKEITERWKKAPVLGEPIHDAADYQGCAMGDLANQVRRYHASSIANGNFALPKDPCLREKMQEAVSIAGYRLQLEGGQIDSQFVAGNNFSIELFWRNAGIAPLYEPWQVQIQLHELYSDSLVWAAPSRFNPQLFLPADTAVAITDRWQLPANLPSGYYNIRVAITDPARYLSPLPLANGGRQKDGSYPLRSIYIKRKS